MPDTDLDGAGNYCIARVLRPEAESAAVLKNIILAPLSIAVYTCCLVCMLAISQSQEAMMQTAPTATAAAAACADCSPAGGDCAAHCSCQ